MTPLISLDRSPNVHYCNLLECKKSCVDCLFPSSLCCYFEIIDSWLSPLMTIANHLCYCRYCLWGGISTSSYLRCPPQKWKYFLFYLFYSGQELILAIMVISEWSQIVPFWWSPCCPDIFLLSISSSFLLDGASTRRLSNAFSSWWACRAWFIVFFLMLLLIVFCFCQKNTKENSHKSSLWILVRCRLFNYAFLS